MSHWGEIVASNVVILSITYGVFNVCESRFKINNKNGPLDIRILSIIYGSLLGDGHAEKRKGGKGTRITFYQEGSHQEYLLFLHSLIANLGYCNTKIPKITTRIGNKGKLRQVIRFSTWTYESFNSIHNEWYINGVKRVPKSIDKYLTPLALAIWVMDDGYKASKGLKLATNCFIYSDIEYLVSILKKKYDLNCSIHSSEIPDQYCIYIQHNSMDKLREILKGYIIPSMKYKITI